MACFILFLNLTFRTSVSGLLPDNVLEPDEIELPEELYSDNPDGYPRYKDVNPDP